MFLGIVVTLVIASQIPFFDVVFAQPGPVWAIVGAAFLIVVIGVLDDLWDLDWTIKLAAQLGVASLVAWQGVQILSLPIGGITVGSPTLSFLITVFAIVLVIYHGFFQVNLQLLQGLLCQIEVNLFQTLWARDTR